MAKPKPLALVNTIWSRLVNTVGNSRQASIDVVEDDLDLSAVERQTENSRKGGTIWEAVRKADEATFKRLLQANPSNADARGPVGDCPIHMLFLYGTEAHLSMARYLIINFPHTITQIYNKQVNSLEIVIAFLKKNDTCFFKQEYYGEMVLHIAIIKQNPTMVEWLLGEDHNRPYREKQLSAKACGSFFQVYVLNNLQINKKTKALI